MSYHRLIEPREIDGRLRPAGTILDYRGDPVGHLEPLDVAEHDRWLAALESRRAAAEFPPRRRVAWPVGNPHRRRLPAALVRRVAP